MGVNDEYEAQWHSDPQTVATLRARVAELEAEIETTEEEIDGWQADFAAERTLREDAEADLADALDLKNGCGPTVLTALQTERDEARAERDALREAGHALVQTVHDYRLVHDSNGADHIETGRAWDRMRRAEDALRAALAARGEVEG